MQIRSIVGLLFVASAILSCAVQGRRWRPHSDLHDHFGPYLAQYRALNPDVSAPAFQYFTQWLNHFDDQDQTTWTQRYLVNDQYWNGDGPIFFMISGEAALDAYAVVGFQYVNWAQQFNALVVCLEHRFYGKSQPMPDISIESLTYLSSEQALADAAFFIDWFVKQNKAEDNLVITFGGSYAGMLSGWMRQKYPNLIDASIASSGPVHATVDFYQYLDVIANSLTTLGSAQCVTNIAQATQKFQTLATTAQGIKSLETMFNLCSPMKPQDLPVFFEAIAGMFMDVVQYNLEIPGPNITTLCDYMTMSSDAVSNYVTLYNTIYAGYCTDVSYSDLITELQNETVFEGVAGRPWFYQSCVEFGYFQSTDSTTQPFGNGFNLSTQTQQCKDVFGFDFLPNVNWTQAEYGDRDPDASDTLWVNGNVDPWHALGVLVAPPGADFNTLLINGTAHCGDMMIPMEGSPASLVPAQAIIQKTLAGWINAKK